MDQGLKERLVGAAVLVAIAVWLIPWVLDGPESALETTGELAAVAVGRGADADAHADAAARRCSRAASTSTATPVAATTPPADGAADGAPADRRRAQRGRADARSGPTPSPVGPAASGPRRRRSRRPDHPPKPEAAAAAATGRLDGAARQLQRGSQCAPACAARGNVRLQGRGFELSAAAGGRCIACASARRRPRGRGRRRGFGAAGSRDHRRSRGGCALSLLNDAGRLRDRVSSPRLRGRRCVARVYDARRCHCSRYWPRSAWLGRSRDSRADPRRLGLGRRGQAVDGASHYFCHRARDRWPRVLACEKIDPTYGLERARSDARRGVRVVRAAALLVGLAVIVLQFVEVDQEPWWQEARLRPYAERSRKPSSTTPSSARGTCRSSPRSNRGGRVGWSSWRLRCRCEPMCGLVGIVGHEPVNQSLYDALTVLQHRGQDAAGIMTDDGGRLRVRKGNGLVRDVFLERHMLKLARQRRAWATCATRRPAARRSRRRSRSTSTRRTASASRTTAIS